MPKKLVKFDKKKHKQNPWMTNGILNSINSKNKMYRNLLQTDPNSDRYNTLKVNHKTYKNIIRRSTMLAIPLLVDIQVILKKLGEQLMTF